VAVRSELLTHANYAMIQCIRTSLPCQTVYYREQGRNKGDRPFTHSTRGVHNQRGSRNERVASPKRH
jgi:hypothetical protein